MAVLHEDRGQELAAAEALGLDVTDIKKGSLRIEWNDHGGFVTWECIKSISQEELAKVMMAVAAVERT